MKLPIHTLLPCGAQVTSAFNDMHTWLLAAHIRVPNTLVCKNIPRVSLIYVAGAAYISSAGVRGKRTWRRRELEKKKNTFFSESLERAEALLYMRQGGGGGCVGYTPSCHFSLKTCACMSAMCEC